MFTCGRCGHPSAVATNYCPNCGQRMRDKPEPMGGPDVLPSNVATFRRDKETRPVGGFVTVGVLLIGLVAWVLFNAPRLPTCQIAANDVESEHEIIYTAMQAVVGNVSVTCAGLAAINPITWERRVSVDWTWQGKAYAAWYGVAPSGTVSAENVTAVEVDKVASEGSSAVDALLSHL